MRIGPKEFVKKNVLLNRIARKLQRFISRFRKAIVGKNNIIVNNGVLHNVKYDIIGNNNKVEIGMNSTLTDTTIHIRGDNHFLKIGSGCNYGGGV